jgi:hypothetical protein
MDDKVNSLQERCQKLHAEFCIAVEISISTWNFFAVHHFKLAKVPQHGNNKRIHECSTIS